MKSNQIVQSLWIDNKIGDLQRMCYNSYKQKGHIVHLYSYGSITNVPDAVILKDANEILHKDLVFKDINNSYATFSDWFRIELLNKVGGWWIDSDTICLKKFDLEDEFAFATEYADKDGNITICNAVIKMPKNSEVGRAIVEDIKQKINNKDVLDIEWTEIGAYILTKQIVKHKLMEKIKSPEVFCPINFFDFSHFYVKDDIVLPEGSYAIHLWNKMWDWSGIDPNMNFHDASYFQKLKDQYLY